MHSNRSLQVRNSNNCQKPSRTNYNHYTETEHWSSTHLPLVCIFKIKRNPRRLWPWLNRWVVAQGNFQSDSIRYLELYAPVTNIAFLLFTLISVAFGGDVNPINVNGSFLCARRPTTDKIWIKPTNVEDFTDSEKIVGLFRSLYALWEAPKLWYQYFSNDFYELILLPSNVSSFLPIYIGISNRLFLRRTYCPNRSENSKGQVSTGWHVYYDQDRSTLLLLGNFKILETQKSVVFETMLNRKFGEWKVNV